ncbi:MAG TPA: TRAP transporter large permease subunit [Candidatus Atribacteria bacterium]|nr:TRAP transporter large permease subunit [Candidatus Atribacteria bacterium]
MEPLALAGISFLVLFILLFLGVKVGISLAMTGCLGFFLYQGNPGLVPLIPYRTLDSFVLTCVPLFILMGEILVLSGATEGLYKACSKLVTRIPGGLLHTNIITCAIFAAISGSSPGTAATIGSVAIPSLKERHYDIKIILGSIVAGGTLGILIPPSINMIVYGMLAEVSVGRLFAAGIIPGISLGGLFMLYILYSAIRNKKIAPRDSRSSQKEIVFSLKDFMGLLPSIALIFLVLGGIFAGIMTPTEAAAIGCTFSLFIVLALRKFSWSLLGRALAKTLQTTCMILFIVVGSSILASFFSRTGIPTAVAELVINSGVSKLAVILSICIVYVFLGCFIDPTSIIVMTASTVLPIVKELGFDMVWFGVIYVLTAEIGMITPPMGLNLFVVQGISKENIVKVIQGSIPFLFLMIIFLGICIWFPSLILWLPNRLFGIGS